MRLIDSSHRFNNQALAVIELDGLARGARLVDDLLKAAQIDVLASEVYSGPRHIVVFSGGVEAVNQAYEAGVSAGSGQVVDGMLLPQPHDDLLVGLAGGFSAPNHSDDAILLVETETIASALRGTDAALKAVPVVLSTWRLGRGIGGRGLFALRGEHANLEAAESVVLEAAGVGLRETQLIPRPDPLGLWARPFGGDPP